MNELFPSILPDNKSWSWCGELSQNIHGCLISLATAAAKCSTVSWGKPSKKTSFGWCCWSVFKVVIYKRRLEELFIERASERSEWRGRPEPDWIKMMSLVLEMLELPCLPMIRLSSIQMPVLVLTCLALVSPLPPAQGKGGFKCSAGNSNLQHSWAIDFQF